MPTRNNTEMNTITHMMIANNHYHRNGLYDLASTYKDPDLLLALDCVMDEGTIDTIIKYFLDNIDYYPEALVQNTGMDEYTYPSELMYKNTDASSKRKYFITGSL